MRSCREVTRLLSESQERELRFGERMELRFHLMICSACRHFGQQMDSLRSIMRAYSRGSGDVALDEDQGKRPTGKKPD